MADTVTIFHNPRCSKSRQTLALLQDRGVDVEVVLYLTAPPDEATLISLLDKLQLPPSSLIRRKEHEALGLHPSNDDAELIRRMAHNPQIIERPIVVRGDRAVLGRPPENVLQLV
jgi:arsenate reductase